MKTAMAVIRLVLLTFAVLTMLMGLLWIGQGLGIIMWPSSSFMLADRQWAVNGSVLFVVSLIGFVYARRLGR